MNGYSPRALKSIDVAGRVFDRLARTNVDSAVIGSVALAVHGYVRATRDLDLGVAALTFAALRDVADAPEMSVGRILEVCRRHRLGKRLETLLSKKRR